MAPDRHTLSAHDTRVRRSGYASRGAECWRTPPASPDPAVCEPATHTRGTPHTPHPTPLTPRAGLPRASTHVARNAPALSPPPCQPTLHSRVLVSAPQRCHTVFRRFSHSSAPHPRARPGAVVHHAVGSSHSRDACRSIEKLRRRRPAAAPSRVSPVLLQSSPSILHSLLVPHRRPRCCLQLHRHPHDRLQSAHLPPHSRCPILTSAADRRTPPTPLGGMSVITHATARRRCRQTRAIKV